MAENYSFFNSKDHDRVYNARHWADYFFPLFKSGKRRGQINVRRNAQEERREKNLPEGIKRRTRPVTVKIRIILRLPQALRTSADKRLPSPLGKAASAGLRRMMLHGNPVKFAGLTRHTPPVFQTNRRRLTLPQADAWCRGRCKSGAGGQFSCSFRSSLSSGRSSPGDVPERTSR